MKNKRSYYTTPLFVIVTLIGLYTYVRVYNAVSSSELIYQKSTNEKIYSDFVYVETLSERKKISVEEGIIHLATPDSVKSIYISSWVAATPSLFNPLIQFVDKSEINSVIIDIKDSTGNISFEISDKNVVSLNNTQPRIQNIKKLIRELNERDIYVIGRLTAFQDSALAEVRPDLAFRRVDNGRVWRDKKGLAFIDPKKKESWDYLVDIARYSYQVGFDEINFDYIRYPSDGNISNINYNFSKGQTKPGVLKKFYEHLDQELRTDNIPISADIFGLVTTSESDIGIGQIFEDILPHFDAIAPMVYPSHYSNGYFGLDNPNKNPYQVIYQSMSSAVQRSNDINEDPQKLRIWVQDFSLHGVFYGEKEIRAQIKAMYDLGLDSYMVWDPKNKYTKSAY